MNAVAVATREVRKMEDFITGKGVYKCKIQNVEVRYVLFN